MFFLRSFFVLFGVWLYFFLASNVQATLDRANQPQWDNPLDLGLQKEGIPFTLNLNKKVKNPGEVQLKFYATNLPNWLSINENGTLAGTPTREDVGKYSNIGLTFSSEFGSESTVGFGEVLISIHPPEWKSNPINLKPVVQYKDFQRALIPFVSNFEKTPLEFTILNGPAWINMTKSGDVFGYPKAEHIGENILLVQVKTSILGNPYHHTTRVILPVIMVNRPPEWKSNPVKLPAAFSSNDYSQQLGGSVQDEDGPRPLQFEMLSESRWLKLDPDGTLHGYPTTGDLGKHTLQIRAYDGELSSEAEVHVEVKKSNEPPYWIDTTTVLPKGKTKQNYSVDLTQYATDPDGDKLKFTKLSGPNWLEVHEYGSIMGRPEAHHAGRHKLTLLVSDGISGSQSAILYVEFEKSNSPPKWTLNPISLSLETKKTFSIDLSEYVTDPDPGDTKTFSMPYGLPWLQMDQQGNLSGTPPIESLRGTQEIQVRVKDSGELFDDVKVILNIKKVNQPPQWKKSTIDAPSATEGTFYQFDLSNFAFDPDNGDKLKFYKVDGPDWAFVTSKGKISGTPERLDVGLVTMVVRIVDLAKATAVASIKFRVNGVNKPPRWRQRPVYMPDAFIGKNYVFDLRKYAVDDDGDFLKFKLVEGPSWLKLTESGLFSGVPDNNEKPGTYQYKLQVSDGVHVIDNNCELVIHPRNNPPVIDSSKLVFNFKQSTPQYATNLTTHKSVSDPENDTLQFNLFDTSGSEPPSWIRVDSKGVLRVISKNASIGVYNYLLRVDDGKEASQGTLTVNISTRKPN